MKNALKFPVILVTLFGILSLSTLTAKAQDMVKVSPKVHQKVVLDNEHVRVIEVVLKPGEELAWHSHPSYVVYVVEGGKIETTEKGKKPEVKETKAGQSWYSEPVTHMNKNVGTTEVKVIVTELKHEAKKKM